MRDDNTEIQSGLLWAAESSLSKGRNAHILNMVHPAFRMTASTATSLKRSLEHSLVQRLVPGDLSKQATVV
ncbi:hypothetical protein DPMN_177310 [Dreissena polymorpha]|uniref:Uncharacterized protein n=1 Tax=Dreissena polymorpha TaxID=45954 RepID=A0A9D4EAZ0_DREPO|nr:hypothetical protein DPMN_177310 [Dreissena polymorpha]